MSKSLDDHVYETLLRLKGRSSCVSAGHVRIADAAFVGEATVCRALKRLAAAGRVRAGCPSRPRCYLLADGDYCRKAARLAYRPRRPRGTLAAQLAAWVREQEAAFTAPQAASALDARPSAAFNALARLERRGVVKRVGATKHVGSPHPRILWMRTLEKDENIK